MQGLHLTADLYDCACAGPWLTRADDLGAACLDAVRAAGLTPVGQLFHRFADTSGGPGGGNVRFTTSGGSDGGEPDRVDRVKAFVPMRRGGQPDEVAQAILWLLSPQASYTTGTFVDVAGGR